MDIEQLRQVKQKFESKLLGMIRKEMSNFKELTGLSIRDIDIEIVESDFIDPDENITTECIPLNVHCKIKIDL